MTQSQSQHNRSYNFTNRVYNSDKDKSNSCELLLSFIVLTSFYENLKAYLSFVFLMKVERTKKRVFFNLNTIQIAAEFIIYKL
ncbi:hypothetical protein FLACOL_01608 [Flavobacterium columnare]|uniref:Uncharacterized protein n=1 Tax=Flavobacterium columnare TaxID=996 RepID=A0A2N9PB78_9FLAO|nr:hypothetical protein FLACOL_01608 [Flavobacterium columnare]